MRIGTCARLLIPSMWLWIKVKPPWTAGFSGSIYQGNPFGASFFDPLPCGRLFSGSLSGIKLC